jgi:hypothetical protein
MPEGRLPKEQICELGDQIFEERIRELVKDRDPMHYVVIDVESGDFEVGSDTHAITDQLRARRPDAQVFCRRVGTRYTVRLGWRATIETKARRGNAS